MTYAEIGTKLDHDLRHAAPRDLEDWQLHEAYLSGHMSEALYLSQCHLRFAAALTHHLNTSRPTPPPSVVVPGERPVTSRDTSAWRGTTSRAA